MNKRKTGNILGISSIITVIISIIIFFIDRGPNADIYFIIKIFGAFSIIGILLAVFSWVISKRVVYLIIGILGNGLVLAYGFLLLIAMGISEP